MKKESGKISLDTGQETKAGRVGCGSNSRRGGKGCRGCDSTTSRSVPSKTSEVGACKDLKGDVFTIGYGNKGRDEDMLRYSMEKIIRTCEIVDNEAYFNCLPMPPRLAPIKTIYVDSLRNYFLKSMYRIFLNDLALIFDNILYYR